MSIAARCDRCRNIGCTFCENYFREAFKKLEMETIYNVGETYIVKKQRQSPQKITILEKTEKTILVKFLDSPDRYTSRYLVEDFCSEYSLLESLPNTNNILAEILEKEKQKFPDLNLNYIYQPIGELIDKVPYSSICQCNPANGGSGVCGCTIGNKMVYPANNTTGTMFVGENVSKSSSGLENQK